EDPENVVVVGARYAVVVSPRAGAVTVVSTPSLRIVRVLRGFVNPHLAAPTADGQGVYVTDDGSGQLVAIRLTGRPRVVRRAFGGMREAFVTSGYDSSLEIVDRASGRVLRTVRVPYGSFNVATFGGFVVTSSLLRGTVTELTERGAVWMSRRYAPATRGVAVA